jgi:hypothetical protein
VNEHNPNDNDKVINITPRIRTDSIIFLAFVGQSLVSTDPADIAKTIPTVKIITEKIVFNILYYYEKYIFRNKCWTKYVIFINLKKCIICNKDMMSNNEFLDLKKWYPLRINKSLSKKRREDAFLRVISKYKDAVKITTDSSCYQYKFYSKFVQVDTSVLSEFANDFKFHIKGDILKWDNLVNICIMVKNAGDDFKSVLEANIPFLDRLTVLDTGSTDNTINIVKEILKTVPGDLYEEPFVNFRDSRNRLLELAGDICCFNIMLDDTYVLHGNLRNILHLFRGDDVATSYSLIIKDPEIMYSSNRITRPHLNLKYVNTIHEIIQKENNDYNIEIPYDIAYIEDKVSDYMMTRTKSRKELDLVLLNQELEEKPGDSRTLYYLGMTYVYQEKWQKAFDLLKISSSTEGAFEHEVQDALYYMAVIAHLKLKWAWKDCLDLYIKCYNFNTTRADTLYFIGEHYIKENNLELAWMFIKHAYDTGFPRITMSVRKDIYNYHIPKTLAQLCYNKKQYRLGEECCRKVRENHVNDELVNNWLKIYSLINANEASRLSQTTKSKIERSVVFVSPGGWDKWNGETLYKTGLGGSESFSIRYGETLAKMGYQVWVYCMCDTSTTWNNVFYIPLDLYTDHISKYSFDVCIINRYHEYIPVTLINNAPKVYFVLHDIPSEFNIIPMNISNIFCISNFHKNLFNDCYGSLEHKSDVVSYGIDTESFPVKNKVPYMFIFPSFPNRGLLPLLQMFPRIVKRFPMARLHIFCDLGHPWTLKYYKCVIDEIKVLLSEQKETVINHGWVNRGELREYWSKAHVWLYPCTFVETCCLTAYEAAASKTLIVSNHLGALVESVGDRGVIIKGDPMTLEWQNEAFDKLCDNIDNTELIERNFSWAQTKSFENVVGDFCKNYIR